MAFKTARVRATKPLAMRSTSAPFLGSPGSPLRLLTGLIAALAICLHHAVRARAEDVVAYRYESYQEDAGRIQVQTQTFLFDTKLSPWVSLRGSFVHDAISGASPAGGPPPSQVLNPLPPALGGPTGPFSTSVQTSSLTDIRWAGSLEPTFTIGNHRISPQLSYSTEHDYISKGLALNYAVDLNEKNTTLNLGWSHDMDEIFPNKFLHHIAHKDADDILIGVNQLLGPKTVLTANFTYGNSRGYLVDQYKGVLFDNLFGSPYYQDPTSDLALKGEQLPRHRNRFITYLGLTQAVTPLQASVEGSYRLFVDSFGITAHTWELAWYQKLGRHVVVAPLVRYYRQTGADFYATHFDDLAAPPPYFTSDYRLSALETFTGGVNLNWRVVDWLTLDASFRRYTMRGLDGVTDQSAYPAACVYSVGARIWF